MVEVLLVGMVPVWLSGVTVSSQRCVGLLIVGNGSASAQSEAVQPVVDPLGRRIGAQRLREVQQALGPVQNQGKPY